MGVYIKGMEMPKKCSECLLAKLSPTGESLICNYMLSRVPWDERPFDCPLVPVPPHGRLIDAEALHYTRVAIWHNDKTMPMGGYVGGMNAVVMSAEIKDAPTIIPAEEGKT